MRTAAVTALLMLVAISLASCAWAGTTTQGLTGVKCVVTGDSAVGYDYSFTVFNNSLDQYATWNVLVAELNIYNAVAGVPPNVQAPAYVLCPEGWAWDMNGNNWKSNSVISYDPISNKIKYWSPPSIAPGGSLSGFVLHYDAPFDSSAFDFATHVLAVQPITGTPTIPQRYTGTNVCLDPTIYNSKVTGVANTWWDKPTDVDQHNNSVPEASAFILGGLGLLAPMGYALARRRACA